MFARSFVRNARIPVALFNTKHFQSRHKMVVSPKEFTSVFSEILSPQDRLLRQSTVGGGSNRVLVLDRLQQVKGVYYPVLCLPHPSALSSAEEGTLGVPVSKYLEKVAPVTPPTTGRKKVKPVYPSTLVILSHPNGVAFAVFSGEGTYTVKLQNFHIARGEDEKGSAATASSQEAPAAPTDAMIGASKQLLKSLSAEYTKHIQPCSTFYFVVRDKKASMTLSTIASIADNAKEELGLPFSFSDSRWVQMSDVVFHGSRNVSLYSNEESVDSAALLQAVTHGTLEVDYVPKKKEDAPSQPAASG
ncbi:hypothetical protein AGDE_07911 [Angomonas deanei]|uniref:Uncharacterized protein n=1 Tax=Angomonas deanei TaxID=59799 RepID=A0A7G2C4T1_9TRYP|nr:hypothetical protein AGDE_07911 [Angomonas deanei]CAD2214211.1 hypothetical protein, conserved [Angomonas deanei]|eukprot:EPY34447.1 hypothetical protein AGDE_07911 [Angomonas deanei]